MCLLHDAIQQGQSGLAPSFVQASAFTLLLDTVLRFQTLRLACLLAMHDRRLHLVQKLYWYAGIHQGTSKLSRAQLQNGIAALHPDWATLLNAVWALISQSDLSTQERSSLCRSAPGLARILPDLEINLPVQMTAAACCLMLCSVRSCLTRS